MKLNAAVTVSFASLLVLYPVSYVALRLTQVLAPSSYWSCTSTAPRKRGVAGPRALVAVYTPIIFVETSARGFW